VKIALFALFFLVGCSGQYNVYYRATNPHNIDFQSEKLCLDASNRFLSADATLPYEMTALLKEAGYNTDAPFDECTMSYIVKNAPGYRDVKESFSLEVHDPKNPERSASVAAVVNGSYADKYRVPVTSSLVKWFGENRSWREMCNMTVFSKNASCE
jgi:hypothetical protein